MGLFDEVRYQGELWQTKSLSCRMDVYEVDASGRLYREHYDTVDKSDPQATGLRRWVGCMTRVNRRMVPDTNFTGEIRMYREGVTVVLWIVNGEERDSVTIEEVT